MTKLPDSVNKSLGQPDWPPLIYSANIPLYIRIRDVLITLLGWILIVDLLEDIWVLVTQWLHVNVFRRTVEFEHLLTNLWDNIHGFFYMSMVMVVLIVLVGLSRHQSVRKPIKIGALAQQAATRHELLEPAKSRLVLVSFDESGNMVRVDDAR